MCGIAGIFGAYDENELKSMMKKSLLRIFHRGYKHYEYKVFKHASIGANRLEIVDRPNAVMPLSDENDSIYATQNGEIFNYKELKRMLENKGHVFKTNSDTEVLAHLYEEYKEKMVDYLDSEMYAFTIYDDNSKRFLVVRDEWGVKPLYYSIDNNGALHVASEIKQLSHFNEIKEIHELLPGHYIRGEIKPDGTIDFSIEKYKKDITIQEYLRDNVEENINNLASKLRILLEEAVKKRVDTDLPIGVYCSGGVDSTGILALARKYHDDVIAIIAGDEKTSSDAKTALRYCKENNIEYVQIIPPTEEEMFELVDKIVKVVEGYEPNLIRQSSVSYWIAKAGRDAGLRVILCGEGPDEIFAGYPEFEYYYHNGGYPVIEQKIVEFTSWLRRTQFQRVDRTSMWFTTEVRVPYFDKKVVEFALSLPAEYKVREVDRKVVTKYILREAYKGILPDYVRLRQKVVLSEGAGYKGNQYKGGLFYDYAERRVNEDEYEKILELAKNLGYEVDTKEVALYFRYFYENGYHKAIFHRQRPVVNRVHSEKERDYSDIK